MRNVYITLKRIPTFEDYSKVGLCADIARDAVNIVNAELAHAFDGKTVVEYDDGTVDVKYSGGPIIWINNFYLPADLFNITEVEDNDNV